MIQEQVRGEREQRLYSLTRFCELAAGMSTWTARRLIREGKLRAVKIGKRVAIPESELQRICVEGCASVSKESRPLPEDADGNLYLRPPQPGDLPPGVTEARPRDVQGHYRPRKKRVSK